MVAGVDLGGRPHDLAEAVVVEAHLGAGGGEVEELLRIDVGDQLGVPAVDEVARRGGGGVAGVVPALEGGDHDGLVERGTGRPADVVHRPTVPSGTRRAAANDHPAMLRRLGAAARPVRSPLLVAFAPPAWAHVEIEPAEAVAGATETLTFYVEYEGVADRRGSTCSCPTAPPSSRCPTRPGWTSTVDEAANTVSVDRRLVRRRRDLQRRHRQLPTTTG